MYTIISALKNVFRGKFINLTVIVSLALGMLFPMLVFCIGNVVLKEIWAEVPAYTERSAGIYPGPGQRIDTEKAMADHPQIELMLEGTFTEHDYIVYKNKMIKAQTVGYKAGFNKLANHEMLYGRPLTEAEANGSEPVCVITTALQKELGCNVGDTITLSKEKFTVKGVFIKGDISVLMPLDTFARKYHTSYAYSILFRKDCDVKSEGVGVLNSLAEEYGLDSENYMLLSDYYQDRGELKNAYFTLAVMLAVASVTLVYAGLNIFNIMVNKINTDMKSYKIKMQLGATKGNIFGFLWVQLLALTVISVGVDAAAVLLLKKFLPFFAMFPFQLDAAAVLLTAVIGAAYVLILSSVLVKKVFVKRKAAL